MEDVLGRIDLLDEEVEEFGGGKAVWRK